MDENTTTNGAGLPAVTADMARSMVITGGRIEVKTLQDAYYLCKVLTYADMVPKDKKGSPEKCLAAYLYGQNVGLDLMTSIQSVAVIGNIPSVWGDAMIALVRDSGTLERFFEFEFPLEKAGAASICIAKRQNVGDALDLGKLRAAGRSWVELHEIALLAGWFSNIYTDADIEQANLSGKDTYKGHRRRMRKMRARAFTLRDGWPDVLKGIHSREEFEPEDPTPAGPGPGPGGKPGPTISEIAAAKEQGVEIKATAYAPQEERIGTAGELRPAPTAYEVQAGAAAAGLPPAEAERAVHDNTHAITEDQHPHDPVAEEKARKLLQDLADRQAIRDNYKTKTCPDCAGAGGDKETGYCKTCVGSGVVKDEPDPVPPKPTRKRAAKPAPEPQAQPELPLAPEPTREERIANQAPPAAPQATDPAAIPGTKPGIDEMQFKLLGEKYNWPPHRVALEWTVLMTLRQVDKGMPVDLYEDFTTGYIANQVAVAGPDKGRPDILAWVMSHPGDALKGYWAWRAKKDAKNQNPGVALEEFNRLKDRAAHIRGADPLGWEKAAVKLGMGQTPMSAEGYKRLLAQYDAMNK
jgi:hypothetical protein